MQTKGLDSGIKRALGSTRSPDQSQQLPRAASLVRTDSASMLRAAAGLACRARSNTKLPQICASAVSQCADVARETGKLY